MACELCSLPRVRVVEGGGTSESPPNQGRIYRIIGIMERKWKIQVEHNQHFLAAVDKELKGEDGFENGRTLPEAAMHRARDLRIVPG